jgi:hypothetical protein
MLPSLPSRQPERAALAGVDSVPLPPRFVEVEHCTFSGAPLWIDKI